MSCYCTSVLDITRHSIVFHYLAYYDYQKSVSVSDSKSSLTERAKKLLKKTDIVGEREQCVNGLSSFAIVVLFGFTFWFAADYLQLYPLETSGTVHVSCDDTDFIMYTPNK